MPDSSTGGRIGRPPKTSEPQKQVAMHLPEALVDSIDRAADARGTSRQALVAEICRQWLAREEQRQ